MGRVKRQTQKGKPSAKTRKSTSQRKSCELLCMPSWPVLRLSATLRVYAFRVRSVDLDCVRAFGLACKPDRTSVWPCYDDQALHARLAYCFCTGTVRSLLE